jgi:hypothetical protein
VAQLGARVNGIHEVTGSIPVSSTNSDNKLVSDLAFLENPRGVYRGLFLEFSGWSPARICNEEVVVICPSGPPSDS